ncbi:hypothetical protein MMC29_004591 [Sticta canariensis]|nr:hypothetical protein [Sticta canariensis]
MPNHLICILLLVLFVTTTSAQTLTDVPECSYNDALTNINNTGCQISNLECICNDQGWLAKLLPQVQKDCSPADLAKTIAFTQNLCKTVGVELNIPALNSTTAVESETPASATASAAATKAKGEENAATVFGAPTWGVGGLMGTVGAVVVVLTWYDTI